MRIIAGVFLLAALPVYAAPVRLAGESQSLGPFLQDTNVSYCADINDRSTCSVPKLFKAGTRGTCDLATFGPDPAKYRNKSCYSEPAVAQAAKPCYPPFTLKWPGNTLENYSDADIVALVAANLHGDLDNSDEANVYAATQPAEVLSVAAKAFAKQVLAAKQATVVPVAP